MSPRAAWRLERLGFAEVYDYVAGKADWIAAGLPTLRSSAPPARAVEDIDGAVPSCAPDEEAMVVVSRDRRMGRDSCVVVNEHGIVVGRCASTGWTRLPKSGPKR